MKMMRLSEINKMACDREGQGTPHNTGINCGDRKHTPITSEAQQGAMGVAYAAKKGKIPMSKLRGPARQIAKGMTKKELKSHLKESKGKDLPKKA